MPGRPSGAGMAQPPAGRVQTMDMARLGREWETVAAMARGALPATGGSDRAGRAATEIASLGRVVQVRDRVTAVPVQDQGALDRVTAVPVRDQGALVRVTAVPAQGRVARARPEVDSGVIVEEALEAPVGPAAGDSPVVQAVVGVLVTRPVAADPVPLAAGRREEDEVRLPPDEAPPRPLDVRAARAAKGPTAAVADAASLTCSAAGTSAKRAGSFSPNGVRVRPHDRRRGHRLSSVGRLSCRRSSL